MCSLNVLNIFKRFIGFVSKPNKKEVENESANDYPKKQCLIEFVKEGRNSCSDMNLKHLSNDPYVLNICQNRENDEKDH